MTLDIIIAAIVGAGLSIVWSVFMLIRYRSTTKRGPKCASCPLYTQAVSTSLGTCSVTKTLAITPRYPLVASKQEA